MDAEFSDVTVPYLLTSTSVYEMTVLQRNKAEFTNVSLAVNCLKRLSTTVNFVAPRRFADVLITFLRAKTKNITNGRIIFICVE